MDRAKGRLTNSLQFHLSAAASAAIVAIALLMGVWSFAAAFDDAQEGQDGGLRATSRLFRTVERLPEPAYPPAPTGYIYWLVVEPIGAEGSAFFGLPADTPDGFRTVSVAGEAWRVFVRTLADNRTHLAVGQRTAERDHLAWDAGLWTALPLLLVVPVLCGLIFLLVRRTLRPVAGLSASLERRTDSDLSLVRAAGLPTEIQPIVAAINNLMPRVARSIEAQRRFIADAAHELRSPLAALSIQAENMGAATSGEETARRLSSLRQGIARMRSLLDQLLVLARTQAPPDGANQSCDVGTVLRSVVEQLLPIADARKVDLEVVRLSPMTVAAHELDLALVLRNLLDNAVRHSSPGEHIEIMISSTPREALIEVSDRGPGIPECERERVFDPFYRMKGEGESGVGLGLSIVKSVILRLDGSICLGWTTEQPPRGLRVRVTLPLA